MENRKGQLTIYGILVVAVMIIIFNALHPLLDNQVDLLVDNTTDQSVSMIVNLYIPILALMILITIVSLGSYLRGRAQE